VTQSKLKQSPDMYDASGERGTRKRVQNPKLRSKKKTKGNVKKNGPK